MDHKTFISGLARQLGKDNDKTDKLTQALTQAIVDAASSLDSVAIPGFGRFDTEKKDEYIAIDEADGQTKLFPPSISITFSPGTKLKNRLSHE